jgi:hypothetical protein
MLGSQRFGTLLVQTTPLTSQAASRAARLVLLLSLGFGCSASTPTPQPAKAPPPAPILSVAVERQQVFLLNHQWFVLYDTGLVIFQRSSMPFATFFSVQLSPDETRALLDDLQVKELLKLDDAYVGSTLCADYPDRVISVPNDTATHALHKTTVEGCFGLAKEELLPTVLAHAFDRLYRYSHPREQPWYPDVVRLNVQGVEQPAACIWPTGWENLDSKGSIRSADTSQGDLGILQTKGARMTDIKSFLRECHEKYAGKAGVLLNGQSVRLYPNGITLPGQLE